MSPYTPPDDPEVFRAELVSWLEANAPRGLWNTASTPFHGHWGGKDSEFESEDHRLWFERCLERGWTAPHWPTKYGGGGMSTSHYRIWHEELLSRRLPLPLVGFGLTMIGPILLAEGNDEQKAFHLPKIAQGKLRWCQGYSEPGAGSDLAALRTRAERQGDEYIVTGQKTWTSFADKADWIFCLVRTRTDGRKQAGISFLLIDMATPGVTVRPIRLISGASPFCEVFLEEVRVPATNLVGRENDGWRVAKALLQHERSMVGESVAAGGARPNALEEYELRDHALKVHGRDAEGRLAEPLLRHEIVKNEMDQAAMRLTIRRINERVKAGAQPGPASSILKVFGSELNMARWELGARIGGLQGLAWEANPYSEVDVTLTRQWLRSRGNSIEGGTSEVQRNIIAQHVLGLPKDK